MRPSLTWRASCAWAHASASAEPHEIVKQRSTRELHEGTSIECYELDAEGSNLLDQRLEAFLTAALLNDAKWLCDRVVSALAHDSTVDLQPSE